MSTEAKVVITAKNDIRAGLDNAKQDVKGFGDVAEQVGKQIKTAFTFLAIFEGLKQLSSAAFDCFKEFGEGERRMKQLKIALDNNSESFTKATRLIDEMNEMTLASKDDIEDLVGELAALGKSDEEIDKITRAAVNLSNITGKDLNTSFTQLNATYTGTSGKLGQLIPELGNLTKEELESGKAVEIVNQKFGELSKTLASDNIPQKLKNINEDIGDIKEEIGRVIAIEFGPLLDKVGAFISGAKEKIGTIFATVIAVFKNFPEVAKLSFGLVLDIIQATFSWEGLKIMFISLAKHIAETIATSITYLPTLFWDVVKLMFTPIKTLADYIVDTLDKAFKLDFKNIQSPGDFIKNVIVNTASTAKELIKDTVSYVSAQANNVKDFGVNLSKIYDGIDFKGFKTNFDTIVAPTLAKFEDIEITPTIVTHPRTANIVTEENKTKGLDFGSYEREEQDRANFEALDTIASKLLNFKPNISDEDDAANLVALGVLGDKLTILGSQAKGTGDSMSRHLQAMAEAYNEDKRVKSLDFSSYEREEQDRANFEALDTIASKLLNFKPNISDEDDAANLTALGVLGDKLEVLNSQSSSMSRHLQAMGEAYIEDKRVKSLDFSSYEREEQDRSNFNALDTIAAKLLNFKPNVSDEEDAANLAALESLGQQINAKKLDFSSYEREEQDRANFEALDTIATKLLNFTPNVSDEDDAANLAALETLGERLNSYASFGQRGQSSSDPGVTGSSGLNIQGQIQAMESDKPSFFQNLIGDFKGAFVDIKSAGTSLFDSLKDTGLSGGGMLDALSGSLGGLFSAVQPLTQILFSANPLMAALMPVIEGFVSIIGPAVTEVLQPLFSALSGVGESLGKMLLPILDAIAPIFSIIGMILTSAIAPVLQILSPIIEILALVISTVLVPVIKGVAIVLEVLRAPAKYVGDLFSWIAGHIKAFGENIRVAFWNITHWLDQKAYVSGPGSFSSDAFTGLEDRINAIINSGPTSMAEGTNLDTNTSTSVAGANYTGGNTITINIYQQAPVVGDNGMVAFARMIRQEFVALDYYNN